jgi:hypothetical protein
MTMVTIGAQIRAARGLLGWSQQDLATAASVHVNAVRYWEEKHCRPLSHGSSLGYGCRQIEEALTKAGVILFSEPAPGVMVSPRLHPARRASLETTTPPIYARWR